MIIFYINKVLHRIHCRSVLFHLEVQMIACGYSCRTGQSDLLPFLYLIAFFYILSWCMYFVARPSPWSITISIPAEPASPAKVTVPSAAA